MSGRANIYPLQGGEDYAADIRPGRFGGDARGRTGEQRREHAAAEKTTGRQLAMVGIVGTVIPMIEDIVADRITELVKPNLCGAVGKCKRNRQGLQDKRKGHGHCGHPAQNPVLDARHPFLFSRTG
jgi:hypothetical protein